MSTYRKSKQSPPPHHWQKTSQKETTEHRRHLTHTTFVCVYRRPCCCCCMNIWNKIFGSIPPMPPPPPPWWWWWPWSWPCPACGLSKSSSSTPSSYLRKKSASKSVTEHYACNRCASYGSGLQTQRWRLTVQEILTFASSRSKKAPHRLRSRPWTVPPRWPSLRLSCSLACLQRNNNSW